MPLVGRHSAVVNTRWSFALRFVHGVGCLQVVLNQSNCAVNGLAPPPRPYHRSLRAQMPKIRHLPKDRHVAVELGVVDPRCYDLVQILLPSVRLDR
jgi:hypothetical protein